MQRKKTAIITARMTPGIKDLIQHQADVYKRQALYSALVLSGELHTYLADLNEQATERCSLIIEQMARCV